MTKDVSKPGGRGFQVHNEPVTKGSIDEETSKYSGQTANLGSKLYSDIDQLGELPPSYGSNTIFLIAQDPHWLFTYWDFDISKHPGGALHLRYCNAAGGIEGEIEVPFETRNWYIPVQHAGAMYHVELGYYRGESWHLLGRSDGVQTPRDQLSEDQNFELATIPLQISFERMMESLRAAVVAGESLAQTLSRLQRDGSLPALAGIDTGDWESAQRILLEGLLGKELAERISSGNMSSEEISIAVRKHVEERLSSEGASELVAAGAAGELESSLSSALWAVSSFGSESFAPAALASWAQAVLSSWMAGAVSSFASAAQSSWAESASASWGGSELSSWAQSALSSWAQAISASWSQAALSSWSTAETSSWSQAAQSSWGVPTSWSQAALSSWGGASGLSSWESGRGFYMHVNAEVIFYGGTDPNAKVTVNGEEVTLDESGCFRYHFKFPDADYEIPIVATSPDGVETRRATLRFERETVKHGKVDNTGQPAHLTEPMGRTDSDS